MTASPRAPLPPAFDGSQPCASTDPEAFFSDDGVYTAAKRVCANCEWREPCLDYALHVTVEGVWGGTSPSERRVMRKQRGILPVPLIHTFDPAPISREAVQKRAARARANVA